MAARNEMLLLCSEAVKRGGLEIHEYNSNNYELN